MTIILIGIVLVCAGAFGIYGGYEDGNSLMAILGWVGIIAGALVTLFGFGKRTSDKLTKPGDTASNQGHAEIRALIQSMGMVAVADKRVRPAEIETIANIHEQMLGLKISKEEINDILSEFSKDFDIASRLERDRELISPTMRRTIVQSCHLVMISDLEVVHSEESRIYEIGSALGFNNSQVDDMISAVAT